MRKVKWKFKPDVRSLVIILLGIVINFAGKILTSNVDVPFWLDSIGTIFSAALLGPLAGVLAGGLSNIVFVYFSIVNIFYVIINIITGIVVGYFFPKNLKDTYQLVYMATILAMITILACTPINMLTFQGYTGNMWGDALCDKLGSEGVSHLFCAILGEAFIEFPDKIFSVLLAGLLVRISYSIPFLAPKAQEENGRGENL